MEINICTNKLQIYVQAKTFCFVSHFQNKVFIAATKPQLPETLQCFQSMFLTQFKTELLNFGLIKLVNSLWGVSGKSAPTIGSK